MKMVIVLIFFIAVVLPEFGADTGSSPPTISEKDLLALRESELRVERAYRALAETPAFKIFVAAKSAMDEKIRAITPEGFQLLENPQTYEVKLVPVEKAGGTKTPDADPPTSKTASVPNKARKEDSK